MKCPRCGKENRIVNECKCDPDNLPTRPVSHGMKQVKLKDWQSGYPDFNNVWNTERYDWQNWSEVRHLYMGKRTMLVNDNGITCLEIEGQHFEIHVETPAEIYLDEVTK